MGLGKTARARFPMNIAILVFAISLIGIMNIASAAQATRPNLYLFQFIWLGIGCVLAGVIISTHTRNLREIAYIFHIGVIVLLLAVLVVGTPIKGSQRWIDLGFFNLQPSELAKLSVILAVARYFGDYHVEGGYTLRDLIRPLNLSRPLVLFSAVAMLFVSNSLREKIPFLHDLSSVKALIFVFGLLILGLGWSALGIWRIMNEGWSIRQIIAPIDVVVAPFLLILVEPDLGTSMIVMAIAASMVLVCGIRVSSLVIAACVAIAAAVFAWNFVLMDYQKQRVESFLNPEADVRGKGYHAAQSMIAIGSGQLIGKGFGEGTQTQLSFLPENHTDFAFAVLGEEWGFVGTLVLMILYLALVLSMLSASLRIPDRFSSLIAVGGTAMVMWHIFINAGMVTGVLPVVGVTLPLMSYGGASMLTQIAAIAFCINAIIWRRIK